MCVPHKCVHEPGGVVCDLYRYRLVGPSVGMCPRVCRAYELPARSVDSHCALGIDRFTD